MIFSDCYCPGKRRRAAQPCAYSAPWTEVAAAGALTAQPPPALAGGSVNKAARLPAGPARPVKGKVIRDFPSRLLRQCVWQRQLPGYARAGLPQAPGHFRPRSPSLSSNPGRAGAKAGASGSRLAKQPRGGPSGNRRGRPLGDLHPSRSPQQACTPGPAVIRGREIRGGNSGLRKPAQGTISRERRRPRRLI